ncbi:MAG: hypothetical protein QM528_04095 [Phycisphaerales bacterium]|nr:hypothetical protein [Phycisphaerales bacterium]
MRLLCLLCVFLMLASCTKSVEVPNTNNKMQDGQFGSGHPDIVYTPAVLMNQVALANNILYVNHQGNERDIFSAYYNKNTVIPGSRLSWYGYDSAIGVGACILKTQDNTYVVSFTGVNMSNLFDIVSTTLWLGSVKPLPSANSTFTQGNPPMVSTGAYNLLQSLLALKDPQADYSNTGILDFLQEAVIDANQHHHPPVQIYFAGHSQASFLSLYFNAMFFSPTIISAFKAVSSSEPIVYTHYFGSGVPSVLTSDMLNYFGNICTQSRADNTLPIRQVSKQIVLLDKDQVAYIVGGYNDYNLSQATDYPVAIPILLTQQATTQTLYNGTHQFNYLSMRTAGAKYFDITYFKDIAPISNFPILPSVLKTVKDIVTLVGIYHYHNSYLLSMGGVPIPDPTTGKIWPDSL